MTYRIAEGLDLPADAITRFWRKVDKENGPIVRPELGRCWIWTGYTIRGYGSLSVANRDVYTHRFSYELHNGPIADGPLNEICHKCDIHACVRPDHLFLGTHGDNIRDMWSKGRAFSPPHSFGEDHHMTTLTDAQVEEIRQIRSAGQLSQRATAAKFGVSQSTVWRLAHRMYRNRGAS